MFFTYHRAGRIPVLPALAAAGAMVMVGGMAVTLLAIVGIGTRLLRTFGLVGTQRALATPEGDVIEAVVVKRSSAGTLER